MSDQQKIVMLLAVIKGVRELAVIEAEHGSKVWASAVATMDMFVGEVSEE